LSLLFYNLDLTKARQVALAIQLNPWLRITGTEVLEGWAKSLSLEFEDYDDFVKKYGSFLSGKPIPMAIATISNYYEGVGTLLHRKLIDISRIEELVGGITLTWEKVKPIVEGFSKDFDSPMLLEWFEYLYNEIQEREQQLAKV